VVLNMIESLNSSTPVQNKFGLYADLVLDAGDHTEHEKRYLQTIMERYDRKLATQLPARFDEVAKMSKTKDPLRSFVRNATNSVVDWTVDPKNARMKIGDQDVGLLQWLAEEKPSRSKDILAPLRSHYWEQLNANQFGVKNFYKAQTDFDRLYEITAEAEKRQFLETTLVKVKEAHRIAKNPDTASFVERVEGHLEAVERGGLGGGCHGCHRPKVKRLFRK